MYLIKLSDKNIETQNEIKLEKVVDDLLLVSIKMDISNTKDFYDYWRLTKTSGIPPLEIGIDSTDGTIQSIVFYVDSTCFKDSFKDNIKKQEISNGIVEVDTSIFKKSNDYVDVNESYSVFVENNTLICEFESDFSPNKVYKNNRMEIYLRDNQIIGFAICDLEDSEIEEIKSL
ncbi:hypothetical protein ACWOFR_05140 [Carnobacterium gallinarum]|uniref:hypothetical protein n=1 Tax=Carnobacterium gallinarum TaxID=2749 RepID=UPI00054CDF63|nr:hypothetical protein [Carnobacterium gallinarum]